MSQTLTQTLTRVFKFGSVDLPDPNPALTPDKVLDMYSVNYPHLATATVGEPTIRGVNMIYEFTPAPVKTKG